MSSYYNCTVKWLDCDRFDFVMINEVDEYIQCLCCLVFRINHFARGGGGDEETKRLTCISANNCFYYKFVYRIYICLRMLYKCEYVKLYTFCFAFNATLKLHIARAHEHFTKNNPENAIFVGKEFVLITSPSLPLPSLSLFLSTPPFFHLFVCCCR